MLSLQKLNIVWFSLMALTCGAVPVQLWAQVDIKTLPTEVPAPPEASTAPAYLLTIVLVLGIVLVAFKDPRRTHLD
ncbi:MAG: hypothetical protein WCJ97_05055 [Phycisphaerae bacterium]